MKNQPLSKFMWFWIPVISYVVLLCIDLFLSHDALVGLYHENGPHELLQFIVIFAAFCIAVRTLIKMPRRRDKLMTFWVGLAALCCLYVAGEELSWGQHLMEWSTPEFWSSVNDQNEINLHNTSSWLDQKPRLVLEIGVLIGGLIIPLIEWLKPALLPARFSNFYAPAQLSVVAGIAVIIKIIDKVNGELDLEFFHRGSELLELYLFYFVFLYLIVLMRRVVD